jgi:predicted PurR-regulated permease PerM
MTHVPPQDSGVRSGAGRQPDGDVPYALRVGAAWSWRLVAVVIAAGLFVWLLGRISLLVVPLMLAGLLASLLSPVCIWLREYRVPKAAAVTITLLGFFAFLAATLTLAGRTMASGVAELWDEARRVVEKVEAWLSSGPLQLSEDQLRSYIRDLVDAVQNNSGSIVSGALSFGSSAGHFAAGALLTVFALIFFVIDGSRIWSFVVGLAPVRARAAVDGAGRRGWESMSSYVRVQLLVAFVDAVGIGAGAAIIGVPLALPLTVLVFIGSFIPVVGATFTGIIAVLLALVANGWVNALVMLAIVLAVQQLEGHFLQPLIMGRAVRLHPLAVVLAVAGGSVTAGIAGALFSVPLLAILNTAVRYISRRGWETDPAVVAGPAENGPVENGSPAGPRTPAAQAEKEAPQ